MVAWRLKIIRQASELPRGVAQTCRHFGLSRVNQGGKRDNQDGKFLGGVVFEPFCSDLTL